MPKGILQSSEPWKAQADADSDGLDDFTLLNIIPKSLAEMQAPSGPELYSPVVPPQLLPL